MANSHDATYQSLKTARLCTLAGLQASKTMCPNLEGDFSVILDHLEAAIASLSERAALPEIIGPTTQIVVDVTARLGDLEGTECMEEVVAAVLRAYAAPSPTNENGSDGPQAHQANELLGKPGHYKP